MQVELSSFEKKKNKSSFTPHSSQSRKFSSNTNRNTNRKITSPINFDFSQQKSRPYIDRQTSNLSNRSRASLLKQNSESSQFFSNL